MKTEIFERLIGQTILRSNSKAKIIRLNRDKKAFIDEDKKSIELAEAIFAENNMFRFRKPGPATDYILHKLINDRKLLEEMKDRGTNIIRLFSLISKYNKHFGYHSISASKVIECGIFRYSESFNIVPLEDSILTHPNLYLRFTVFNDKNPDIRKRLTENLTKDKTKLDIFVNGILAIKNSDLVLSCINTIEAFNEEARNYVNRLQERNMLDKILNQDDTTLEKLALKELLKLFILQSTTLEFPQVSSVVAQQYFSM